MTHDTISLVREFQDAYEQETPRCPAFPGPDQDQHEVETLQKISAKMQEMADALHRTSQFSRGSCLLRLQLIQEELGELAEAMAQRDPVAALDALCDLRYVLDGTVLTLGLHPVFARAFEEVHRSNMTKLGPNGRPVRDPAGRVVKGPNYERPRLDTLLENFSGV